MPFRICKRFEVENAHMLSAHPEKCKFPHGHSRTVEVVLGAEALDGVGMVCDFKAVKLAIEAFIDTFDHAICVNTRDALLPALRQVPGIRLIEYEGADPTTEVMARHMFKHIQQAIQRDVAYPGADGKPAYRIGAAVRLERVRLWETKSSWAEYYE